MCCVYDCVIVLPLTGLLLFLFFIFIVNYLLHLNVAMTNVSEVWINLTSILSVLTWMFIPNWYHSRAVRNYVKLGISLRVLYCVVDTGYWLGRSLGDCRPALPKGQKYSVFLKSIAPSKELCSKMALEEVGVSLPWWCHALVLPTPGYWGLCVYLILL